MKHIVIVCPAVELLNAFHGLHGHLKKKNIKHFAFFTKLEMQSDDWVIYFVSDTNISNLKGRQFHIVYDLCGAVSQWGQIQQKNEHWNVLISTILTTGGIMEVFHV